MMLAGTTFRFSAGCTGVFTCSWVGATVAW
jgi:hypothetical protein